MALVAYTITAIERDVADATASGKQIVAGASCSLYEQPSDSIVILYDDAAGSNGATTKLTNSNGQVTVYVTPGVYRVSVNGVDSYIELETLKNKVSIENNQTVPSSYGIVMGVQDYESTEIGAGSLLITGYSGASNNRMLGEAQLRTIVGGYDSEITSGPLGDGANSAGLACCIFSSHHSEIRNEANHCTITGGSYNIIDDGTYNTILGGTANEIIGTYNAPGLQNNTILGGARNILDGANSVMGGADNTLEGLGSLVVGTFNDGGATNGSDYCVIGGSGNTVERDYSACFGFSNSVSFGYGLTTGRNNTSSADYQLTSGRSASNAIKYAQAHGFATGDTLGEAQSIVYPLTASTTDATPKNMTSIAQGSVGPAQVEDTMVTLKGVVTATDGTDAAVFDVEFGFLRASASTTTIYNTSTAKGASAGAASWTAAFGGQTDGRIVATGEAAKNITWYADVRYVVTPI